VVGRNDDRPRGEATLGNDPPALAAALADIDGVLPGSVVTRHMRCGKATCACKTDPTALHGPYIQWTRTVDGKPSPDT